ncbi:MAG: molybdopterin-dependent oxidoreductase, partial [bacterium]|nr:molybdopterin-dependent oxidoreductase [bacterium]
MKDSFPRASDGSIDRKYLQRGKEPFLKISWDEAFEITAKVLENIARTYSGKDGADKLLKQGYDPAMVEAVKEAGVRTLKFRGGMPALGAVRIFSLYRLANSMALLDAYVRGVDEKNAFGARGWDNYSWHTDLPPGHPMVTGQQTVDWDLVCVEHSKNIIVWGMNWITTKMPDSHWLAEARMKGAKVTVIACEYSATANKADNVLIVRPGTAPALAHGFSYVILKKKLYSEDYIRKYTDLVLLVRMDNLKLLKPEDIYEDYKPKELRSVKVLKSNEKPPPIKVQEKIYIDDKTRSMWSDFVVWDIDRNSISIITRDEVGNNFKIKAALEGSYKVKLKDGKVVEVRPVFEVIKNYILENFSPEVVEEITWAPKEGIIKIAENIAAYPGETLFAVGMGPNQFFNNDLKDRAIFFLAALTKNIGRVGGNVGSYAGNFRSAFFNGLPTFIAENPFNIKTDGSVDIKMYYAPESAHYFNYGDRVLRVADKLLTGKSHIPTPTKAIIVSNSNSLIGNAKWHYDTVVNVFPKIDFIGVLEWWWTGSCEYADIVYPVDSWLEFKSVDATISVTNPFLTLFPSTPLPRIYNTKGDFEVVKGIAEKLADLTGDERFRNYFSLSQQDYLQRIFDNSQVTAGYSVKELEEYAKRGVPALMLTRTYPKFVGYEQAYEDKTW